MAANKPDFSLGRVDLPDIGGGLLDFADRQQKQYQIGLSNAVEADKLLRDKQRFAREQELNARQDTEYNRELGLRTGRQDLAKEFLANPYAAKFGGGKETTELDKSVLDYVNKGGVIDEDMAKRLQSRYEEVRPFKEDATNALTSQMVLLGEDPTKAAQLGKELGSNLLSRVEQQAAVSANRKIEQEQYDEAAKRNKEALQLKLDIAKANQAGDKDKAELLFKQYQSIGGGSGGGSSTANVLMETLGKIGPIDASSALAEGGPIDLARKAGYTESQIAKAAGQSLNTDPTSWTWADNKLDTTMFTRNLGMQPPGSGLSKSINIRDIQEPTAEEWASIVPARAGYRVVDYDPKRFLEGSKSVLPELFSKDTSPEKPLLSEVKSSNTDKKSGETLADRNNNWGNIKYDKGTEWQGGTEGEKGFVKFDTPELGARALAKTIMNGGVGKTVDQYINKYAPASDNNDTKSYIADVAKTLGKKPDERITLDDVPTLMQAIAKREGGNYSKDVLDAGYKMAVSPQLAEFHKAVNANDGSANRLLADMSTKFNDKSIDWSNGTSNADVSPVIDLFGKVNTSKYGINAEVSRNHGGVGGENPDQKIAEQRIAEINNKLGAHPAPTPENLALMDERSKLNPRSVGSKAMDYVDTLRRELIDPLGPTGYAVGGIPKIGTGLGKLGELLRPTTKPMVIEDTTKLLENLRPQGSANWTGTGKIATDKLNGISADTVLGQAGNQGNRLAGALRNADESKRLLEETPETKLANLNYFSNASLNKLNLQAPVDARRLLDGAIEARSRGQIDDTKLFEMIQKIDDTKLLSPRELMEALDKIGFKR